MTYVVSAVLDLTERICRRFPTWTGRTNVWLAFHRRAAECASKVGEWLRGMAPARNANAA